ncbi:TPA: DUF2313 domain-containing protein [Escherichia coli]|nr:DUF2313 domain-containing protein [Escherichia coli]
MNITSTPQMRFTPRCLPGWGRDVTCSSACTDAVNAPEWRYYWHVNMPAATNTTWMTCGDPCNSALRIWGDTVVECVLNKLCPSHTYVIFKYPE